MKQYTLLSTDFCNDEAYYEIKENNVIIMSSTVKPTELVIFIKGKRPKVIFKECDAELKWLYNNIKLYFEGIEEELDQSDFIAGSLTGMVLRLEEVTVTYFNI